MLRPVRRAFGVEHLWRLDTLARIRKQFVDESKPPSVVSPMVSTRKDQGMGTSTPRPTGTVPAASYGDLVCGLASTAPPLSYVGELGAATDAASQSVVSGLLRAAKAPTR